MFGYIVSTLFSLPLLVYVAVGLLAVWYLRARKSLPDNIPPFPVTPLPVFGHVPLLGKDMMGTMKKWQKTTGDIYSIYMGQTLAVVLSSYDVLKEAFVKNGEHFSNRSQRFIDTDDRFVGGVVDTSGPLWKEQRGVTISILKKFGMGKNWMGEKINLEVDAYLTSLAKSNGEPINVRPLTNACVSNVICTILTGNRFELDDPYFQRLFEVLAQQIVNLQGGAALRVFPWLKHLPGDLFKAKAVLENEEVFRSEFSLKYINKIRESKEEDMEQNFIHSYLMEEISRKESGKETTLNEQNLIMVITNLFQAGSETVSTTIMWALLYALHYPDIQDKLYQEIDEVIGTDRLPNVDDKTKLPYVNAFIMETQRLGIIVPFIFPHECSKTTTIAGYTIPEGTMIMPNLGAILHDSKTWGDPMVFRPERFIDEAGSLDVPEHFIPFSIGRRVCLGDALAKLELFLFITGVLQKFHIRAEDPDNLPSLEPVFGLTCTTQTYKIRLVTRQQ